MSFIFSILLLANLSLTNSQVPPTRGLCITPSIKNNTDQLNWDQIRLNNRNYRLGQLLIFSREVQVGDTKTFWSWDLSIMPPQWIQVPATCRAVGDSTYIFVADNCWNIHMDQQDVDTVLSHFEHHTLNHPDSGIIQLDVQHFGDIPDELDNDRHVYIFYSALGSYQGTAFDGYFSAYNQMTEAQAQAVGAHSNEVEMFYMTCYPLNPSAPQRLSVLAHELQHMIHWNMDEDEETWIDEGCAEMAMWLYGLPDPITGFPSQPDNDLTRWDQLWADYIQTYLFIMYLHDHYGGSDMIKTLVAESLNSIEGVEQALITMGTPRNFSDIFTDWTVANFINDTAYDNGQYGYYNLVLPSFNSFSYSAYPVNVTGAKVNSWGTDYLKFINGRELSFVFNGSESTEFSVPVIMYSTQLDSVIIINLDSVNYGQINLSGFGTNFDKVVVAVSRIVAHGDSIYDYFADALPVGVNEQDLENIVGNISFHINIKPTFLHIYLNHAPSGNLQCRLTDIAGRIIQDEYFYLQSSGSHNVSLNIEDLTAGRYFLILRLDNTLSTRSFSIVK